MRLTDQTVAEVLQQLGDKCPAPGGGAVAPLVAALASALARMVVNYSVGKASLAEHHTQHRESLEALSALGARAVALVDEDAEAYARLSELMKLPRDDPRRQAAWSDAVEAALAAPKASMGLALDLLARLDALSGRTNRMLDSDLAIAAILATAAARAAAWNVRINLPLLEDDARVESLEREIAEQLASASTLAERVEAVARAGS